MTSPFPILTKNSPRFASKNSNSCPYDRCFGKNAECTEYTHSTLPQSEIIQVPLKNFDFLVLFEPNLYQEQEGSSYMVFTEAWPVHQFINSKLINVTDNNLC